MKIGITTALLISFSLAGAALAGDRSEDVKFDKGAISKTVKSSLKGYDTVTYTLDARAGQLISILFSPNKTSCYFNVNAPGNREAIFIGSTTGNEFTASLTESGKYSVQVYLMRNDARRKKICKYEITFEING